MEPSQDPDNPILDALAEKSLTQPYTYGYGAPYGSSTVNVPAVGTGGSHIQDLDGLKPATYETNGPSDGFY